MFGSLPPNGQTTTGELRPTNGRAVRRPLSSLVGRADQAVAGGDPLLLESPSSELLSPESAREAYETVTEVIFHPVLPRVPPLMLPLAVVPAP